jgi:hypothetical protein
MIDFFGYCGMSRSEFSGFTFSKMFDHLYIVSQDFGLLLGGAYRQAITADDEI